MGNTDESPPAKPVVIFGSSRFTSLAWYCLSNDSPYQVVGFTVDLEYLSEPTLHGLPFVAFEELEETWPPEQYQLLIPLAYKNVNRLRAKRYLEAKARGYQFASYVSSSANTWPDLNIGENCMIYESAIIQPFVKIGDNVVIRAGVNLGHHVQVGDHCFIAAETVVGGSATIGQYSFLGLNVTVRDNTQVAESCVVAAGAVVVKDTEANGLYVGVPAKRGKIPSNNVL